MTQSLNSRNGFVFLAKFKSTTWWLCFGFVPLRQIHSKGLGGFVLALKWVCFSGHIIDSK